LRPVRTEIPPTYWEREGKALVLHVTEFAVWLGFTIWLLSRPHPKPTEPIELVTRRELNLLRTQSNDSEVLSGVSRSLRRYFAAAFHLPPGEHTTEEFCRLVVGNERIGFSLAERTVAFLRRCDASRFAATSGHIHGAVAEALEIVESAEARRQEQRELERVQTSSANA
jgi:hypothetical protein